MPVKNSNNRKIKEEVIEKVEDFPKIKEGHQVKHEAVDENFTIKHEEPVEYELMLPEDEVTNLWEEEASETSDETNEAACENDVTKRSLRSSSRNLIDKISNSKAVASSHKRIHTERRKKCTQKFKCNVCRKAFSRKDNLDQHIKYVHGNWKKSELFTCDCCGKGFKYKKSIVGHMNQHIEIQLLICKICKKRFRFNISLKRHMLTHGRHSPCKICGKKFKHSVIQCHMKEAHAPSKKFKCEVCQKAFSRKGNLVEHIKYVHRNWKNSELFTCDGCGKGFKYKKSLDGHMKQHMEVQPLICKICQAGFSVNSKFKQHMLTAEKAKAWHYV